MTFVLLGVGMPTLHLKVALMALGLIAFAMLPVFTDSRLVRIENEVQWADRTQAAKLLETLEQRRLVALFAPFAWVQLQRGRLHLRLGDGRAAARSFAEAARLCGQPELPALLSGQAHGLTLSGDRKEAQAILRAIEKRGALSPYDRLNLGINLIEEGRAKQALEHLEQAAEVLDQHPRALSAFALALAKSDRANEASEVFARAEAIEDLGDDALAPDLLKRARKALRSAETGKGAKRAESTGAAQAKPKKSSEKKRSKKDRRKERRERRKGGKPSEPAEPETAVREAADAGSSSTAEAEREKAEREQAARERAEREQAEREREQAERAKAEREKAEHEKAEREKAEREKAERERAAREQAEREKAERERAAREQAEREQAERERAAREKAAREQAEREQAEREQAEREKVPLPPPVVFEGDKPVFRPPTIPAPPKVQAPTARPAPVAPPKISVPEAPSTKNEPQDEWGDLFGGDDAPVVPAGGKKDD